MNLIDEVVLMQNRPSDTPESLIRVCKFLEETPGALNAFGDELKCELRGHAPTLGGECMCGKIKYDE